MAARRPLLLLLAAIALAAFAGERRALPEAYVAATRASGDSVRARSPGDVPPAAGSPVLASLAGLPPEPGTIVQSGGSVVFRPDGGGSIVALPLFQEQVRADEPRTPAVRLLEVAASEGEAIFLFHLGSAVIETASPGILGTIASEPGRVSELGTPWRTGTLSLAPPGDEATALDLIRTLVRSGYADTLYSLFGMPERSVGLVGVRGRRAGRLGEYLAARDSVALSPAQMTSSAQLRHTFAHELAHRWLRDHPQTAEALAAVMPPIRDSLRYGFRDRDEQLAETLAFAVHFLQASSRAGATSAGPLLHSYERLVPGTRNATLLLLTFPEFERHPLAGSARALRGPN